MGHRNFCCDGCQTLDFNGRRFHCLRCVNYDLCKYCYDQNVETQEHRMEHPMQVVLDPEIHQHLPDLMLNGDMLDLMHFPNCYTCPYCGLFGHTAKQLIDHVVTIHSHNNSHVVCPMCANLPGIELVAICNLARHLLLNHIEHANLLDPHSPPLRQTLARSSRRRRRQQAQNPGSQNGNNSRNSTRSNTNANHLESESGINILYQLSELRRMRPELRLSQTPANSLEGETRTRTATLAIANLDVPNSGSHEAGSSVAATLVSEQTDADSYLLPKWMSQQQLELETGLRHNDQRQKHALFTEHLLLSMICEEQLELPEDCEQQQTPQDAELNQQLKAVDINIGDAISLQSLCKYAPSQIMILMSLPWIRPWSSQSNLRYIELQGITIDESTLTGAAEHQDID